jgi:hypothetical protein
VIVLLARPELIGTAALASVNDRYVAINGAPTDWFRGAVSQFITVPLLGFSIQRSAYDLFLLTPTREGLTKLAVPRRPFPAPCSASE